MKGIINIANFISDNYITILALILIIVGVAVKVKKFFSQDREAQKEQLKDSVNNILEYIKVVLNDLVVKAEKIYGSGTGVIKKSYVYRELIKIVPSLEEYIIDGDITIKVIGDLIDDAVDALNKSAKKNSDIGEIFNHEPIEEKTNVNESE